MANNKSDLPDSTNLRDWHERMVLMAFLMSQEARDEVLWRCRSEWFRVETHQIILAAIQKRNDLHQPIDAMLIAADLQDSSKLQAIGGEQVLIELGNDFLPSAAINCSYYTKLVREQWIKRQAKYAAYEIAQLVESDQSLSEIVIACERTLGVVCETVTPQTAVDIRQVLLDSMPELEKRMSGKSTQGLTVGFHGIDKLFGGLRPGQVVVIAARPSVGKSAWAINAASSMVMQQGLTVFFVSMEMTRLEISVRLLSAEAKVAANEINDGFKGLPLADVEMARDSILQAASRLQTANLFIDETPSQTVRAIAANAKRIKRKHGLDALFIDYLQLIEPEDRRVHREQQVAIISRKIKVLAKELNIPIVLVAQANRQSEKREEKRPQLSDLRESGAIEADADIVGFLHRDDATPNEVEFIIRKNRSGTTGTVKLGWIGPQTRFIDHEDMAPTYFGPKLRSKTF